MTPAGAVRVAHRIDADWIFVGRSDAFNRQHAAGIVEQGHAAGLDVHVGRPLSLQWARHLSFDSCDTTAVARNEAFHLLTALEQQTGLDAYVAD